jgi:hypothetical protein
LIDNLAKEEESIPGPAWPVALANAVQEEDVSAIAGILAHLQAIESADVEFGQAIGASAALRVPIEVALMRRMIEDSQFAEGSPVRAAGRPHLLWHWRPTIVASGTVPFVAAVVLDAMIREAWPPGSGRQKGRQK